MKTLGKGKIGLDFFRIDYVTFETSAKKKTL